MYIAYVQEAKRQLSNTEFCTPDQRPQGTKLERTFQPHQDVTSGNTGEDLASTPQETRPGVSYNQRIRNVATQDVSYIGTIRERVSRYTNFILLPYATEAAKYLKASKDFLKKLGSVDKLPPNTVLTTVDMISLYTQGSNNT